MALSDILKKATESLKRLAISVKRFSETMEKAADNIAENPTTIHFETITVTEAGGLPPLPVKRVAFKGRIWYLSQFAKKKRIRKKNLKRWESEYGK